jgi:hypothetical protein
LVVRVTFSMSRGCREEGLFPGRVDLGDPTSYFAFALSFDFVCFGFFGVFAFLSI